MEYQSEFRKAYDFLAKEYGLLNMSLTTYYSEEEGVAEIQIRQSGLMSLINDLLIVMASKNLVDDGILGEPPQEEIKCTFDEVMKFSS